MSATQRRIHASVEDTLLAEPFRFEFFQAVRLLELSLKAQGANQGQAVASHIRFENSTSLAFPPSEVESLRVELESLENSGEIHGQANSKLNRYYLTPSFIGFLGPNGTLPRHYSERIATHELYKRDDGPRAFLDAYSNRAVALFYAAWKKYRLELEYESRGDAGFLPWLMALSGLGHASLRDRLSCAETGIEDESLAFYAGALRQRPVSATYLEAVLSEYFAAPIKIKQFVGKWYPLPKEHQSMLGLNNVELGASALLGQVVWQRDLRIGLAIGPLRKKQFEQFLPRKAAAKALEQMLKILVGVSLEFEVQLVLHSDDVSNIDLSDHRTAGRLGWDTFLATQKQMRNRSDVSYTMNALA